MISSKYRFHGLGSLNFAYKNGKTVRLSTQINLKYVLNQRNENYRASVVVSKKVSKSAVVRNRIRRRIYEVIRLNQDLINGPYDLIFSVFDVGIATQDPRDLSKLIIKLLSDIK